MMTGEARFRGSCTTLITPFSGDGLDKAAFKKLVSWQIEEAQMALFLSAPQVSLQR